MHGRPKIPQNCFETKPFPCPHGGMNLRLVSMNIGGRFFQQTVLAMLDRRGVRRRHKAWIDVAETTIAGNHMRRAFLDAAGIPQSHTMSPAPRFCTAHHGALPKLPAWLADAPQPIAAASPAAASVDLKLIVMVASLSRRDIDARPSTAAGSDATYQT